MGNIMDKNFKSHKNLMTVVILLGFVGFWFTQRYVAKSESLTTLFTNTYGSVALFGGVSALLISKYWGGVKSLIGRAVFVFGLGLLAQEFGQLMYAYYIYVQKVEVPYPSLGDIGYFGSVILYIYGAILLLRATGVQVSLKTAMNKVLAFLLPTILLTGSYFIFLRGYEFLWDNPLTVLLDLGYPLLQAVYLAIALLTFMFSRKYLGGAMRPAILMVLVALTFQYVADFTFLYQVQHETWAPGGINDLIYLISYGLMTFSLVRFENILQNLGGNKSQEVTEREVQ
jgi:hypothetical protein